MPHYICPFIDTRVALATALADASIAAAYIVISCAMVLIGIKLRREYGEFPFRGFGPAFALFIFLCGLTHLSRALALWVPWWIPFLSVYAATAVASVLTARALWFARKAIAIFILGRLHDG